MFITDPADADLVGRAHGAAFGAIRPAATMVVVSALLRPEWNVEIEAEDIIDKSAYPNRSNPLTTSTPSRTWRPSLPQNTSRTSRRLWTTQLLNPTILSTP